MGSLMRSIVGDKVRLRHGDLAGLHGVVRAVERNKLVVAVSARNRSVTVLLNEVTNLSLAARKAWLRMPHRRVGRPRGSKSSDRVSVTLRIDRDLWDQFRRSESKGLIGDRTSIINKWLRQKLDALEA